MSRGDNWIPIDKNVLQEFKYINRPFSRIEALVSFTADVDCGHKWSLNGYSKLWQWSREKVKKFVSELQTDHGHSLNRCQTHFRHPIHIIDKGLWKTSDRLPTDYQHSSDTLPNTTSNPNNNPNPNKKKTTTVELIKKAQPPTPYKEIIDYLNLTANTNFKPGTKVTQNHIKARINEGFTVNEFKKVIESKVEEWQNDNDMVGYLRPQTLFGTKFEGYLQAAGNNNPIKNQWKGAK